MTKAEEKLKHLEFIQLTIVRMAANSFLLKGWTVTVAAALFALAAKDSDPRFAIIALFAALAFWGLDAYYLRQERLFRRLYNDVRRGTFLETDDHFCMSTKKYRKQVSCWASSLFSFSVLGLHGVIFVSLLFFIAIRSSATIASIWHAAHFSVSTTKETSQEQTLSEIAGSPKTERQQGSGIILSGKKQSEAEVKQ